MSNCGKCHECGTKLQEPLDWCPTCKVFRRYRSHGWLTSGDPAPCLSRADTAIVDEISALLLRMPDDQAAAIRENALVMGVDKGFPWPVRLVLAYNASVAERPNYPGALTDEAYRYKVGDDKMPKWIRCPECGRPAGFKRDTLAARYECSDGHATAAMHADWRVFGDAALVGG